MFCVQVDEFMEMISADNNDYDEQGVYRIMMSFSKWEPNNFTLKPPGPARRSLLGIPGFLEVEG